MLCSGYFCNIELKGKDMIEGLESKFDICENWYHADNLT